MHNHSQLLINNLQRISKHSAIAVFWIGCIVIVGWCFDIGLLKSVLPGLVTMKANTAFGFIFSGLSLWAWHQTPGNTKTRLLAQGSAILVFLIGFLTLVQYGWNVDLGIDQLVFQESVDAVATASPGRMALNSAFNFLIVGSALMAIVFPRKNYLSSQILTVVGFLIAYLGLLGYLYGNAYFYKYGSAFTAMALHTAIAFILSTLSIFLANPNRGLVSLITMNNAGGILAQRLILAAVIIPPLICWLMLLGYRYQIYTAELAICLLGIINVIVFSSLIAWNARALGKIDRKRHDAEASLKRANEDLEQRVQERTQKLEQTLFELRSTQTQLVQTEKMSSLGQLVAGVAHEINNPVNFIYGNLNHAQEYTQDVLNLIELYQKHYPQTAEEIEEEIEAIDLEFLKDDLPRLIGSMKVGSERIKEIVKSLRTFSRMDESQLKEVDIHEGLDSTLMILHNRLKAKPEHPEIQVIKDYGDIPLVECYAGQLNQVFMNLIANAIDALDEYNQNRSYEEIQENPSYIRLQTYQEQDQVKIIIEDNGLGIPEESVLKLFDPFFTTKPVGKGTGLGLAISYQIVTEKHQGELTCVSQSGEGAKFEITLPLGIGYSQQMSYPS
ncbi:sensor histidine kinase [Roseofilum capinflatum]|uniref:histidine kinase n=1 Tax=Roseofilum capinflatum BLCC-M114 TaxID=3022440 RepID=A0ABT7B614_9CYAN|nr:ATP-binding protein [Roseofilum capinflatum]MDJ1174614.1 ATP-binding protein [Roseofilum capinflatum BLCC-M114]